MSMQKDIAQRFKELCYQDIEQQQRSGTFDTIEQSIVDVSESAETTSHHTIDHGSHHQSEGCHRYEAG